MNNFTGSFIKNFFWGLICVLFFLGSAAPALCAPKKPKKDKKNTTAVAETQTAAAENLSVEGEDQAECLLETIKNVVHIT